MPRLSVEAEKAPGLVPRFARAALAFWRFFFPPEIVLDPRAAALLARIFPRLDLSRVSFHLGFPHVYRLPNLHGITLPAVLGTRRTRIFLQPDAYRPETPDGLGLLVHEAFHAQQLEDSGGGLGLFRPFFVLYLACAAKNWFRYAGHPVETDAYELAGARDSAFEQCCGHDHDVAEVFHSTAHLARESSGLAYGPKLVASTPLGALLVRWADACAAAARTERGREGAARPLLLAGCGFALAVPLWAVGFTLVAVWLVVWIAATALLALTQMLIELSGGLVSGFALLITGQLRRRSPLSARRK